MFTILAVILLASRTRHVVKGAVHYCEKAEWFSFFLSANVKDFITKRNHIEVAQSSKRLRWLHIAKINWNKEKRILFLRQKKFVINVSRTVCIYPDLHCMLKMKYRDTKLGIPFSNCFSVQNELNDVMITKTGFAY